MDVVIVAVGRLKAGPESELCARYLERARGAGRELGLGGFSVRELPEARAPRAEERKAREGEALLQALAGADRIACLDPAGDSLDSEQFAQLLRQAADAGRRRLAFVIGGADGLAEPVLAGADRRIAFGRLTWPHQIARLLLAEQLYRAATILSGHPYHRA